MPRHDKADVEDVKPYHPNAFPQHELTVPQEHHTERRRHNEEPHIPDEALLRHMERPNQRHTPRHDGSNKARSAKQLPDRQTPTVGTHSGKRTEDVRAAVAEGQEGDAGHALGHAEDGGDGAEVDAEEVRGGDADGGEEQAEPGDQDEEGQRLGVREVAVEEREVGHETRFVRGAVGVDEGALVVARGAVDEAAFFVGGLEGGWGGLSPV